MVKFLIAMVVLFGGVNILAYADDLVLYPVTVKQVAPPSLRYDGILFSANTVDIKVPEHAELKAQYIAMGEVVKKGQVLLEWTSPDLLNQFYQAKKDYIECEETLHKLKNWNSSSQMINAKRDILQTEQLLNESKYRLSQTKKLFEAGVISKEEYTIDKRNTLQAAKSHEQAKEILNQVLKKGEQSQLSLAKLKFKVAKQQYNHIKKQVEQLKVISPFNAILVPSLDLDETVFGTLIDPSHWKVVIKVNEWDAITLKEGQNADVVIPALNNQIRKGKIDKINIQPVEGADSKSLARYEVSILILDDLKEIEKSIRLRMSATVSCHFPKIEGIFIPKQAIVIDETGRSFVNLAIRNGPAVKYHVELGSKMENEVQVIKGLKEGDNLVLLS